MSTSDVEETRRIDFPKNTKTKLAERAGLRCSYRTCLKETKGPSQTEEGEDSSAGIAVAAHIYPASANGPRKQDGLSAEQIKHISNGIWLCQNHAKLVDVSVAEYPAETLLQMKAVREYAQHLSLTDETIATLSTWMGVQVLDAIVWKHWPDPDETQLRHELYAVGAQRLLSGSESIGTDMPIPPSSAFDLKPLTKASIGHRQVDATKYLSTSHRSFSENRHHAVQIVGAWKEEERRWGIYEDGLVINNGFVKLTARDCESGAIAEPFVWSPCMIGGMHRFTLVDGEKIVLLADHSAHQCSNLNWSLVVVVEDGACRTNSTLSMWRKIEPSRSDDRYEREQIEAYIQVIEKLAAGWEPIGFVGLTPGDWSEPDSAHSVPFEIQNDISQAQLSRALQRAERVKLGYALADKHNINFRFNDAFFREDLDEPTIQKAAEAFFQRVGRGPYPRYIYGEPIMALSDQWELRLAVKFGTLYLEIGQSGMRQPWSPAFGVPVIRW